MRRGELTSPGRTERKRGVSTVATSRSRQTAATSVNRRGGTGPAAIGAAGPSVWKVERQGAVGDRWRTRGVEIRQLGRQTEVAEDADDDGEMLAHETVEDGVLGGARQVRVGARDTHTLRIRHVEPNGRRGGRAPGYE